MSDNLSLRMTIDVCVFAETKGETLAWSILRDGVRDQQDPLAPRGAPRPEIPHGMKLHPWGIGERQARAVMDAIKRGDIEIDDIRDIEDHT